MQGELGALQALLAQLHHCDRKTEARNSLLYVRHSGLSKKLAANAKKAEEKLSEIKNETLSSLDDLATEISQKIISDLTPIKVSKSVVKKHVSVQSKLQN